MIITISYAILKLRSIYSKIEQDTQCYTYQIHIIQISQNRFKFVKSHIRVFKSLCDERISTKSKHNANAYEYIPLR